MKKIILSSLLILATTLSAAPKETKILPILDGDFCPAPTVALMGGYGKYADASSSTAMYGLELGFACPVFQIKDLEINQVLSVVFSDEDGLKTTSIEMNPRVMFELNDKTKFGFGPGLGLILAERNSKSETLLGFNLGASLNYQVSQDIFVGVESRYQWTQDAEFTTGVKTDMNNLRTLLKVGKSF